MSLSLALSIAQSPSIFREPSQQNSSVLGLSIPPARKDLAYFVTEAKSALERGSQTVSFTGLEIGQTIGEIFTRAVTETAISSEIDYVETRYNVSLAKIIQSVDSLNVHDILAYSIGVLQSDDTVIDEITPRPMSRLSADELESYELAQRHKQHVDEVKKSLSERVQRIDLNQHAGLIQTTTLAKLKLDKMRDKLAKQTMDIDQLQEVLSKCFATSFLQEGMHIPLPALVDPTNPDNKIRTQGYFRVEKIISRGGLMAFALVPINAPDFIKSTVLFRPTAINTSETDALRTIVEDMQDEIGKPGFDAAKDELHELLMNPRFITPGERAWVCGFSLGGAHAARLLASAPDSFSKAFFFNDPSTEEAVSQEFESKLLTSTHAAGSLDIRIFHTQDDDVPLAGSRHIGHTSRPETESKINVSIVKIQTRLSRVSSITEEEIAIPTVADAPVSFYHLCSLAYRVNREFVARIADHKFKLHCTVMLSKFEDDHSLSNRHSTVIATSPVAQTSTYLSRRSEVDSDDVPSVRFNRRRLSATWRGVRVVVGGVCSTAQNVINLFSFIGRSLGSLFSSFYRNSRTTYMPYMRQRIELIAQEMREAIAVPPAGNPHAEAAPIDIMRPVREFLTPPPPGALG